MRQPEESPMKHEYSLRHNYDSGPSRSGVRVPRRDCCNRVGVRVGSPRN